MPRKKKTEKYSYLIDYVKEAAQAREPLRTMCGRAIMAYKQKPSHNSYRENAKSYQQSIANNGSAEQAAAARRSCRSVSAWRADRSPLHS
mgnify:CR=1 FL=1